MKHYDIAIIGGGMVGAALACALQHTAYKIILIDATPLNSSIDHRLIALTYNSCMLFKNLQLWPELVSHATAINAIHVSNRGHFGSTQITAQDAGLNELGHLVPAKDINAACATKLATLKNLEIRRPAKLTGLNQNTEHATLTVATGATTETITAQIVVGADGTHSTVREILGIKTETVDYQQKALVAQVDLQRSHHHIAYERFTPTGAIAMLPLQAQRVATIWSDSNERIDGLLKLSDDNFLQELQQQFGYRLGKLVKSHQRACYPLQFVKAHEQQLGRVVLIGNAAHTVHPIAAQGLNLALYEIAVLSENLITQSPTTLTLPDLSQYFNQQKNNMVLSHRLTQLFSADFFALNIARQAGLLGLDICVTAKQQFIKRALGRREHIPNLFLE